MVLEDANSVTLQEADNMTLDCGFCFYEDSLETVKRAIESIRYSVRYIFAIDGKFEFYESDRELSTPEIRQYLQSIPNVILVDCPNRKENEKRQKYFDLAQEYLSDWIINIDADEFITKSTDWIAVYKELKEKHKQSLRPCLYGVKIRKGFFPRIMLRPYLIQCTKTHNFFEFKTDHSIYKSTTDFPPIHNIEIRGDDKLRTKQYINKSFEYQKKLMAYEKPFKEEYRKIAVNTKPTHELNAFHGIPMV